MHIYKYTAMMETTTTTTTMETTTTTMMMMMTTCDSDYNVVLTAENRVDLTCELAKRSPRLSPASQFLRNT